MVMNKKAQGSLLVILMLGMVFFLLGLALSYPLNQVTSDSRTQMNCSEVTAYQDKANCVVVDMFNPLLVGTILGLAGMILGRAFL